jgi:GDP-4-dehydro-6-deoxy-D-mannose reductase
LRVLVTGSTGFVGGHLVEQLTREPGLEVFSLDRRLEAVPPGVAHSWAADLGDGLAVREAVAEARPDAVVHLAAQSSPQRSWQHPSDTFRVNVGGLLNVLESLRGLELRPRVVVVGSSEEYGRITPADLPLREDAPLRPLTPYASSKVAQGVLALQYTLSAAIPTLRTRTFHHTGPRRGESFAESSFARQIAEIEAGLRPPVLQVGNLDAVRDFTDVRDVARAYRLLLDRGTPGEVYNVCSGVGVRIRDILGHLLALSRVEIEVRVDPARLRASDVPAVVGDPTRLREATGWVPEHSLRDTLAGLLDDWRSRPRLPSAGPA